jgi:O-antigen biosynthesis protein
MTDWAWIAGGRCQGDVWRVGIAGAMLGNLEQGFLLSDADWHQLQRELPLNPLQSYGDANGLLFERIVAGDSRADYHGVLLIAQVRDEQPLLELSESTRRYLLLREVVPSPLLGYARVFLPAERTNDDELQVPLNQPFDLPLLPRVLPPFTDGHVQVYGRDPQLELEQAHFAYCDEIAEIAGWLPEQWRQCLAAGVVPVHLGDWAVPTWLPQGSYVDARDFASRTVLDDYLNGLTPQAYQESFSLLQSALLGASAYPYSVDCWINVLTATIAADALQVRGQEPLLSVIIPAYNYGRFLGQTVRSVLDQGLQSIEVLVLDNASSDDTPQVMRTFSSEPNVRYMRNRWNIGPGHNVQSGVRIATGQFMSILMADDFFNAGHLSRLLPLMQDNPQVAVGYTPIRWVNEQGLELNASRHPGYRDQDYLGGRNEVVDLLVFDNYIAPSAAILRRSAYLSTCHWNSQLKGAGDWEMVIQLAERFPDFAFVNTPGVSYRMHGAQYSNDFYASTAPLEDHIRILEGISERGSERHVQGHEREIAAQLAKRLSNYPQEQDTELGQRSKELCERFEALARSDEQYLFSIILTTYNRPDLLKDALASVGNQQLRDFEVILINDNGSPVESLLADYDYPITYIRQGRNQGLSAARNAGLKLAQGRFVCFLDDDDMFASDHLETLAEAAHSYPEGMVFYTDACYVQERLEGSQRIELGRTFPFVHGDFSADSLAIANYIPVNTWCVPRSLFAQVGEFDTSFPALEDWEMLLRITRGRDVLHLAKTTVEVRVRGSAADHMSQHQRKNFPALFRKIYARNKSESVAVEQGRLKALAALDLEFSGGGAAARLMFGSRPNLKVGVVLYVYYPDLWNEFKSALKDLYAVSDFFITTVPEHADEVRCLLQRDFPKAKLFIFENRGRDMGQLFSLMEEVELEQYDFILKLHTKKSLHLAAGEGDSWREHVLSNVLPVGRLNEVFAYFEDNPDVGLLGPKGLLFSVKEYAGQNFKALQRWACTLGFDFDLIDCEFVVGSMFWARGAVFKKLRSLGVNKQDFERESGQVDGTLAHVLERVMSMVAKVIDLRTVPLLLPSRVGTVSAGVVSQWQRSRKISGAARLYLDDYFNKQASLPVFAICVLDFGGDALLLADTLQSLSRYNFIYPAVRVFVFSDSVVKLADFSVDLVFVPVNANDYVSTLNSVLERDIFDWLMLVRTGEELTKYGMARAAQEIISNPDCRALYGDEFLRLSDGSLGGAFRPAFNFDLLLSFPQAMAHHWLFNREAFLAVGGFDSAYENALELDLLLRLVEQGGLSGFAHVDEPLIVVDAPQLADSSCEKQTILRHLNVRGYQADILTHLPGRYRIAYNHNAQPLVSIIVPTKDQLPMLQRCVESLLEKTHYTHYELLIVDNNSETLEAREWLAAIEQMGEAKVRVLRYPHPFNYSAINNMAAREARGEYLVLLNNDTAIISDGWLDALLNHAQRPEVGIVGAKLLHADGTIQHGGIILGLRGSNQICGPAQHPFVGEGMDASGFMNRLQVDQNYSAVTAACLMIRKSIYDAVAGLDEENFKVSYNDVDLCLKVGDLGYLTVWTPHAVVMHEGSVSQKQVDPASLEAKHKRFVGEQNAMYAKWLPKLASDPAYNANLALNGPGFTLETNTDLTWRPLAWRPLPVILAHNGDPWGCGHYRIIKPHRAMRDEGLIDGAVADRLLEPAELQRLSPDVVVYQRQTKQESLDSMERSRRFSTAFKVYELDDYLPNTPIKSAHRSMMSKDLVKLLRKGLGYVDRFVVSTPALANALSDFHADIRIAENRLPLDWWGQLALAVNPSTKPRVGWAGGAGHQGDLELIADVVRDLAGEVDWVFFGMCPDKLRPYVAEYIPGIDIQLYPEKLASLRLDLALAPLEDNLFNACKSNLRLLEYGICGFPVIASDIECYRGGLPVTLVKNRYRDWVEAIRTHLADRQALAIRGLHLREVIQRDWMLTGACLEAWRDAWLPD